MSKKQKIVRYPDTAFMVRFKKLKSQRNNHLIDEPSFDEAVEQLAADIYGHESVDGWCCACGYDIALMESRIKESSSESI